VKSEQLARVGKQIVYVREKKNVDKGVSPRYPSFGSQHFVSEEMYEMLSRPLDQ